MEIRKNFGKYWLAGLIFAVIAGVIQWATSYLATAVRASFQPGVMWGLILGIMGMMLLYLFPGFTAV